MTNLATPNTTGDVGDLSGNTPTERIDQTDPTQLQWAPTEEPPKKRRWGLWIGVPAGLVVAGAAAASAFLIAPGTQVAGVPVGFMTQGAAEQAIADRLAETTVTLGEGGPAVSGSDVGASVDAQALAASAFEARPAWNVTQWFGDPISTDVSIDAVTATTALGTVAPDLFVEPVNASVALNGDSFEVTPATNGQGVDVNQLTTAFQTAFADGEDTAVIEPTPSSIAAAITTDDAEATVSGLNSMLDDVGFYVDDEEVVAVDRAEAASWITVEPNADGELAVSVDAAKIEPFVEKLPEQVNQEAVDATVVTNTAGDVLATKKEGQDGRELDSTDGIADAFAEQLAAGNGAYKLPVSVTEHKVTELARTVEVDLSAQHVYLKENGEVVKDWSVATGRPGGAETYTGNYTIRAFVREQTMISNFRDAGREDETYEVPNVEWVMYFNGDQAFHGVYWQDNHFSGTPGSNGCIGMSNEQAKELYYWTELGTEVKIYGQTPGGNPS